MKIKSLLLITFATALFVALSCNKAPLTTPFNNRNDPPVIVNNRPPVANAGPDQLTYYPQSGVVLNGRASSDSDNNISNYYWRKILGPSQVTIVSPYTPETSVAGLIEGEYQFELMVTDSKGEFSKDTCAVTMTAHDATSMHMNAQPRYSLISLPVNSVELAAFAYLDNGRIPVLDEIQWAKIAGPGPHSIQSPDALVTNISGLVEGLYVFRLAIKDSNDFKDSAFCTVAVINPASPDREVIIPDQHWNSGGGFECDDLRIDLSQYLPPGQPVKKVFIRTDCDTEWQEIYPDGTNAPPMGPIYQYTISASDLVVSHCNGGCTLSNDTPDIKIIY